MNNLSYFSILCFVWAIVGIGSRLLMVYFGKRWNKWELEKAYSEEKPRWIYLIASVSLIIVAFTWYKVITTNIMYSWIIALLISLTLIKVFTLIFNYHRFREFVGNILNDKKKLAQLNVSVLLFSIVFILMGIYLY